MHHYRKTQKAYRRLNERDRHEQVKCSLCLATTSSDRIIDEGVTMVVVRNRVAYEIFEGRKTTGEHFMIVPRRHVESLAELTDDEKIEMVVIASKYESDGYNIYARAVGSAARSQKHQHTHLIKLQEKFPKVMLYIEKPYIIAHF
jgi:diadenosine tetraphosphate (Ap4A) HIT family hydrolase